MRSLWSDMIYRERLFKKELRRSYLDGLSGSRRLFVMCVILALSTFGVHMLLQLAFETALPEYIADFTTPGTFSVMYSFNLTAFVLFAVRLIAKPDAGVLSEFKGNKWYLLSKMGYKTSRILFFKTVVSISAALFVYAAGFAIASAVSGALNYYFTPTYILSFFISGAFGVLLYTELMIFASLASGGGKKNTRIIFLSAFILDWALKLALGYFGIIGDGNLMLSVSNLFSPRISPYGAVRAALVFIMPFFIYSALRKKSGYYLLKNEIGGVIRYGERVFIGPDELEDARRKSLPAILVQTLLAFVLFVSLLCNSVILTASLYSSSGEFSFFGYMPYVFRSATMEPLIYKNDLAVFKKIDSQYPISAGDVVLFKSSPESTEISVMKVTEVRDDKLIVDYLKYPILYSPGSLKETVSRSKIYGIFFAGNRILGTVILLINTLPGRILTILLPAALLIFPRQLMDFMRRLRKSD